MNPYTSPLLDESTSSKLSGGERIEKAILWASLLYMLVYVPYFIAQMVRGSTGANVSVMAILPAHFAGMALNIVAFGVILRDLYLRPFPNANSKLTWLLLILLTGGVGWLVYVFKYALKRRTQSCKRQTSPRE